MELWTQSSISSGPLDLDLREGPLYGSGESQG